MLQLREKQKILPQKPGVYLFKDQKGEVLYVGKAKNLRNRIKTYFQQANRHEARIALMIKEIADLEYTIVSSETESLILENNFIKQYRPRYNVRLRDDKNYQFIKIDYVTQIPQIYTVRKIGGVAKSRPLPNPPQAWGGKSAAGGRERSKYFGPYTSGLSVRNTLKLLLRVFHLCANKKVSNRACFYYHLGRCEGVCIGKISPSKYRKIFHNIEKFLQNRQREVSRELDKQMRQAALAHEFERAGSIRDSMKALERIWEKQKVVFTKPISEDYLSIFQNNTLSVVNLFAIRGGRLVRQEIFEIENPPATPESEVMQSFIKQYYATASDVPKKIVSKASRGKKSQLLELGRENAQNYFEKNQASFESALSELALALHLPQPPHRIEAYDISNIQGYLPVGSMVVFENGSPDKAQYRKFKINVKQTPDDFAMMREMIVRRFARSNIAQPQLKARGGEGELWPLPDLIVIDGGRGQLNAAIEGININFESPLPALSSFKIRGKKGEELQLIPKIPTVGLAKRLEEIYLPEKKEPIHLPEDSPALYLLQRMRDEAHRFAITFYRKRHRKEIFATKLNDIHGVGQVTRKKLLRKFGSLPGIRSASLEALAQEVGLRLAKKIKEML